MPISITARRLVIDQGGGKARIGLVNQNSSGRAVFEQVPTVSELKLGSANELIGLVANAISQGLPDDQAKVILSIAGPVSSDGRLLQKLTNHSGVEATNIPVSDMVERAYKDSSGSDVELIMLNDGAAGAWAEFGPGGALENLPVGFLGMAMIIGNGVGGRMYMREENGISLMHGADEPGHWIVNSQIIRPSGLDKLVDTELECGCGKNGHIRDIACFETLTKGPAIESMFRRFLSKLQIGARKLREGQSDFDHMSKAFPASTISRGEADRNPLFALGQRVTNKDISAFLAGNPEGDLITEVFFSRIAKLFVARMADLQHNFNSLGPITFTFIGGIGCSMGEYLIPLMERGFDCMENKKHVSSWDNRPALRASKHPADHTNLIGSCYYLIQQEQLDRDVANAESAMQGIIV